MRKVAASGVVVMCGRDLYGIYEDFGVLETVEIVVEDMGEAAAKRCSFHDIISVNIGPAITIK